jgi:PBSX family phage terminase large subunit
MTPPPPASELIDLRGAVAMLYNCRDSEVLVEGRAGTGKTIGILTKLYHVALLYPGARILICRQTRASCTQSVMVTWEEKVLGPKHPLVAGGATRAHRESYVFPNGSEVVFGGLDHPERLFSTEWDIVYVNEATEITLAAWELFGRSLRNNKVPYQQQIADCNPNAPGHWLNKRATRCPDYLRAVRSAGEYRRLQKYNHGPQDGKMRRLVSVHQDNPAYFEMKPGVWGYTPVGRTYLQKLAGMSGHRLRRMALGLWTAAEGIVYPEFEEDRHVCRSFVVPREWPCYLAEDPGYDHPTVILVVTVAPNGRKFVCHEYVKRGTTVEQDAQHIKGTITPRFNIVRMVGDPHYMFSKNKHNSGETIAMQMSKHGLRFTPAPAARNQAEIGQQVELVRTELTTVNLADGMPMLRVFDTCPCTVLGFQTWDFDRTAQGEMKGGEDRFSDDGDDEMDCVRMIISGKPKHLIGGGITVVEG